MEVGTHEAKTHLSRLLRRVALGEEITIRNGGRVVARLVPVVSGDARRFGRDRGRVEVAADFDDPLPEDLLDGFEQD